MTIRGIRTLALRRKISTIRRTPGTGARRSTSLRRAWRRESQCFTGLPTLVLFSAGRGGRLLSSLTHRIVRFLLFLSPACMISSRHHLLQCALIHQDRAGPRSPAQRGRGTGECGSTEAAERILRIICRLSTGRAPARCDGGRGKDREYRRGTLQPSRDGGLPPGLLCKCQDASQYYADHGHHYPEKHPITEKNIHHLFGSRRWFSLWYVSVLRAATTFDR